MYSREIVDEALKPRALGWTRQRIASTCGVSQRAVSRWLNETRRNSRAEADRTTYCPRRSDGALREEAYAYVLGTYLSDGHIVEIRHKPGLHTLSVFYDKKYPQLIAYCQVAMESVLPVKACRVKRPGCIEIKSYSKHWTCVFPQHGSGKKHERPILLQPWRQRIVKEHSEALIRGLMHSDGCRTINRTAKRRPDGAVEYHEYPRYHFTNVSTDIIGVFTHALDRLGIAWRVHVDKREPRGRDAHIVSISRKDAVAVMERVVGPKY
ncbi:LAGLIDADG family homing endonuclease [Nocardiopsis alkaliphila]|uniref:LAGLIDADG family homing endonuclease n=1 Tax=Nocardiopsis alkaliphila TaxID=225762 RepID=UPI00034A6A00|nr:LAGLIDADG family homing endonuclease [Nocardiopsis alkaliphila]